jgi:hypothetical protein
VTAESESELAPGSVGRWLVETHSGSRHLFDLDTWTYSRSGEQRLGNGLDSPDPLPIVEVDQWPRVNTQFWLWLDVGDDYVQQMRSSYVTRIVELSPGIDFAAALAPQTELEAVAQVPPSNAWLLMGDEASFPDAAELRAQRDPSEDALPYWTCPRQIMRGDLVFIYFMAPRSAVHFAARALYPPVYDPSIEVNAERQIDPHQWWTELSPLVEVQPVSYSILRALHGGHLNLRGKPTNYLKPAIVERMIAEFGDLDDEQRLVLQKPVGAPELPSEPELMQLEDLRRLPSGALRLESMVEEYVVAPLTRMCFPESENNTVVPQVKVEGAGVVDYAVYHHDQMRGVIEVKLGVRRSLDGGLRDSPDLAQAVRYATAADVPAMLIDSNEIFLIDRGSSEPSRSLDRQRLTTENLAAITDHFLDPSSPGVP